MMCISFKASVCETALSSPNEWTIMVSKDDLERDTILYEIGNNILVVKDIELLRLTPGVYSCISA